MYFLYKEDLLNVLLLLLPCSLEQQRWQITKYILSHAYLFKYNSAVLVLY